MSVFSFRKKISEKEPTNKYGKMSIYILRTPFIEWIGMPKAWKIDVCNYSIPIPLLPLTGWEICDHFKIINHYGSPSNIKLKGKEPSLFSMIFLIAKPLLIPARAPNGFPPRSPVYFASQNTIKLLICLGARKTLKIIARALTFLISKWRIYKLGWVYSILYKCREGTISLYKMFPWHSIFAALFG